MKNKLFKNRRLIISLFIIILFMGITIGYSNLSSNLISSLSASFKGLMDYNVYAYIDGVRVSTIPLKTDGYVIDTSHGNGTGIECTDNATASWDNNNWAITIGNTSTSGTRCNIYFKTVGNVSLDCNNNPIRSTVPSSLQGLARTIAEQAFLDNSKSEFVSSCNGVDFSKNSSDTNGKGVYEIASTKNDTYPIYYYRGAVTNNNVLFANFCWKIVRTTDTGGVKLIYNGTPTDGQCTNTTGEATQIDKSSFNSNMSPAYVGYMYGTIDHSSTGTPYFYSYKRVNASSNYIYGNGVIYNSTTGIYTLTDTLNMTSSNYNKRSSFNNYHYTCFTTSNTCTTVYYVFYIDSTTQYYITITGVDPGTKELIYVVIEDMLSNDKDSIIKTKIDDWYSTNMTGYTNKLEDTIFCNDRSIDTTNEAHGLGGWNPDGGLMDKQLYYSGYNRVNNYTPTLTCSRDIDKFTVSNSIGNGKLTYPVGLLTVDEVMYAGGKKLTGNSTYYLNTNQDWWLSSPDYISGSSVASEYYLLPNGGISGNTNNVGYGLRPSVSLASNSTITQGDGTATNPYVVE